MLKIFVQHKYGLFTLLGITITTLGMSIAKEYVLIGLLIAGLGNALLAAIGSQSDRLRELLKIQAAGTVYIVVLHGYENNCTSHYFWSKSAAIAKQYEWLKEGCYSCNVYVCSLYDSQKRRADGWIELEPLETN